MYVYVVAQFGIWGFPWEFPNCIRGLLKGESATYTVLVLTVLKVTAQEQSFNGYFHWTKAKEVK